MDKNVRKIVIKYSIGIVIAGLLVWWMIYSNGYDASLPQLIKIKILADAFTVPGLLMVMFYLLLWAGSHGALNALTWAVTNMFYSLVPGLASRKESYGDYLARKSGKSNMRAFLFLLIIGGILLIVAFVFLFIYIRLDPSL